MTSTSPRSRAGAPKGQEYLDLNQVMQNTRPSMWKARSSCDLGATPPPHHNPVLDRVGPGNVSQKDVKNSVNDQAALDIGSQ